MSARPATGAGTAAAEPLVPVGDTRRQYLARQGEFDAAIRRVLDRSWFVLGAEVAAFEAEFAAYLGVAHAVGVGNGTDAIELALRVLGIGPGDEVILPALTATFSALADSRAGATPVFADVERATANLDARSAAGRITPRTRAIMPVHLYGAPADLDALGALARRHGLALVEDAAQAHGATYRGRRVGGIGALGCFSFYPSKNLGAYGDGGAVVTDDAALAERLRRLRHGGQAGRYEHVEPGVNSRLDELQAAVLRVKLAHLDEANEARVPGGRRGALADFLKARGIATQVHYPTPVHLQPAYAPLDYRRGDLSESEAWADEELSLPLFPELTREEQDRVIAAVRAWAASDPTAT
jgi:dTDP-4-amino-4,6-dideoxygalactose transaminase